jgi:hypothetical protein
MLSKRTYESGSKKRKAKEKKTENLNLMRGSMNKFLRITNISGNLLLLAMSIFSSYELPIDLLF